VTNNPTQDKPNQDKDAATPRSPEKQDAYVRDELDQEMITHQGDYRKSGAPQKPDSKQGQHLGATDDEVVPITPPMAGPADLVGERNIDAQGNETGDTEIGEEMIDPRDELTPG
jgi:hypothetical protein